MVDKQKLVQNKGITEFTTDQDLLVNSMSLLQ